MTFKYPVIITPHTEDSGFHAEFPDLEMCYADGADLEDTIDAAFEAGSNWITVELEEFDGDLPESTHPDDIPLKEGQFVRIITVHYQLMPDND